MIELVIEPGREETWQEFQERAALASPATGWMAFDGVVPHPPASTDVYNLSEQRPVHVVNFDHHRGVSRETTLSTAQQVEEKWATGLRERLMRDGEVCVKALVNDSDPDVAASWWIISRDDPMTPVSMEFIAHQGLIDRYANGFPFPPAMMGVLERNNWVNEAFHRSRMNGDAFSLAPEVHREIIEDQCERMDALVAGNEGTLPLDMRYNLIHQIGELSVIEEVGAHARFGAVHDGARMLIMIGDRPDGLRAYSLWKQSSEVDCDLERAYDVLNSAEPEAEIGIWGGSDTCGAGGKRAVGSSLELDEVVGVMAGLAGITRERHFALT